MLRVALISAFVLGAPRVGAGEPPWQFGDAVEIEPAAADWSQISVLRRRPAMAWTASERLVFEAGGALPSKVRVERTGSDLLEFPDQLADLRGGASWDPVVDRYGFWDAMAFECGEPGLIKPDPADRAGVMFVTVYYTPLESGFTAERGFDVTPETRPGLGGRKYGHDFLRTVVVEGFGRLKEPVDGKGYIKYDGRWGYATRTLGNRNNTLAARRSIAVHRRNKAFSKNSRIGIYDPEVFAALGSVEWRVADTGGGLHFWQGDLFWGEDVPLGPGLDRFRPKGCPLAMKFWVPVLISPP